MYVLRSSILAILLAATLAPPAAAHSLEQAEQQLRDKEAFFQAVDREAPGFTLQDADGRAVGMAELRGKVIVLNFIYMGCPDVCPLHSDRIAEIQAMVNRTPMKDLVAFVTITTDPRRDAGQVLRDYGAAHGLDAVNWTFLTAAPDQPEDSTRQLAKAFGLEFTRTESGEQMHGVVTHVIDQDGRLRARFHGLDFEPVNLVVYVNALTNGVQKPHHDSKPGLWSRLKGMFR